MILMTLYEQAKAKYEALGVNVEAAMETLKKAPLSLHCWQGDRKSTPELQSPQ